VSASSSCNITSSASTTSLCTSTVSSSTSESTSTYCASSALTLYSNSHSTGQTGSSVSNALVSTFGTLEIATITLSATETLSPEFTTFVSPALPRKGITHRPSFQQQGFLFLLAFRTKAS
jgi:hypothetical protein